MPGSEQTPAFEFHPLTPDRWVDLEALFGPRGATGGCWCMYWRQPRAEYEKNKGEGNRLALKALVESGKVPGLLAYAGGKPVGWVSVAPREEFPVLERSRVVKRVDDQPVWSVVCFFVAKEFRKQGLTRSLLEAAVRFANENGASLVEGYPVEPKKDSMPSVFAYTGFSQTFEQAGFEEVTRRSETRPIMRRKV